MDFDASREGGLPPAEQGSKLANFVTGLDWFDAILPSGVPVPSSILISGPSGTGKPFVGLAVAASWLKQGGRVVFIPIHGNYPSLFERGLKSVHDLSLEEYSGSHFFILFDTRLDPREKTVEVAGSNAVRCNLINPKVWREALAVASASMEGDGPIMVFGSSLNVLLMSPSYGEQFFLMLLDTIRDTDGWTYLLAISSSILKKKSIILEQAADHLFLMLRGAQGRQLMVRAARVRGAPFHVDPVLIPSESGLIEQLIEEAVASRRILIPTVSRV
jgi:KaiC/GvpD/RAD55 family RecA-like ATPase